MQSKSGQSKRPRGITVLPETDTMHECQVLEQVHRDGVVRRKCSSEARYAPRPGGGKGRKRVKLCWVHYRAYQDGTKLEYVK
jgi:hypothetical protein